MIKDIMASNERAKLKDIEIAVLKSFFRLQWMRPQLSYMRLVGGNVSIFDTIPGNFLSVLASGNKEIYVDTLMLLHQMFKCELNIRVDDYISSLPLKVGM